MGTALATTSYAGLVAADTDCPVASALVRGWEDQAAATGGRDLPAVLKRRASKVVRDERSAARSWTAADWLVRVRAASWLELAGQAEAAGGLRRFAVLDDESLALVGAWAAGVAEAEDMSWERECAARDGDHEWLERVRIASFAASAAAWDPASRAMWEAATTLAAPTESLAHSALGHVRAITRGAAFRSCLAASSASPHGADPARAAGHAVERHQLAVLRPHLDALRASATTLAETIMLPLHS